MAKSKFAATHVDLAQAQRIARFGIWEVNIATRDSYWSDEMFDLCGIKPDSVPSEFISNLMFLHPDDRDRISQKIENAIKNVEEFQVEGRILRPDGSLIEVWIQGEVICDKAGAPNKIIGTVFDITNRKNVENSLIEANHVLESRIQERTTELRTLNSKLLREISRRKQVEDDLRKERDRAQRYLDVANLMLLGLDKNGYVTLINKKGCEMMGYQEEELIGKKWIEICSPSSLKEEFSQLFTEIISENTAFLETYEAPVIDKWGNQRLILWKNSLVRNESNDITGVISSGEDITDLRIAEEEQKLLQEQLQQAQKMEAIGQLTGGIAHDFNNILGCISGFAKLSLNILNENIDTERFEDYLQRIHNASERGIEMVNQLLTFSKGTGSTLSAIDIWPLLSEGGTSLIKAVIPPQIQLHTHCKENLPQIMGNSVLIEQVLLNLCINARDAINGSGTIEIGTQLCNNLDINCVSCREKLTGNFVEISVKDSGEGIDTALITRIFDPFFSTKERTKGTGMGLSIVHGIVHELRGHILVESNLGHGTTFRILFPKATGGIQPVKNTGHHQRQSLGKPRIMVVDDNESQAHLIQEILKSSAYEVMVFNDSVEAIDYFTEQPHTIDLIVTDQIMPKMRGTELAEKALQISPNLPIIMCTAYSENVSEIVAKSLGFAGYIPKPINIRNLRNMIEELV